MTTELVSRRTVVVSWLLTSLCLRYGVAKPSVWLCRKARKLCQFNGFRSDYPLNFSCFGLPYWSVLEHLHVQWFFVALPETVCSLHEVSRCWSQSPGNIAFSWNHVARGSQIRNRWRSSPYRGHALTTACSSEHAGRFLSPPRPLRVAARKRCLNPYRKSWVNLNTVACFTGSQVGHPGLTICWRVRMTQVTGKHTTVELRDGEEATKHDGNSTVDTAVLAVDAGGVLVPQTTSPQGQKGTHHASKSRSSKFHTAVYNRGYRIAQGCKRRARRQGFP